MITPDKEIIGVISVLCGGIGYSGYIWSIFKKQNKPHLLSWIVWVLIAGVVFAAQWDKAAGIGSWATGFQLLASLCVAILSVFRGEKNITRSDRISFVGGLSTIPLWYFTKDPLWSVILAVGVNLFAFYPTFRKSFIRPYEESTTVYIWDAASFAMALLVMENSSLTSILYPLSLIVVNMSFVAMLLYRRAAPKIL